LRRESQLFFVQLSNPKNGTIKVGKGTGTIKNENGLYFPVDNAGYNTPTTYPGYTLTWSDEFSGRSVDGSAWTFESGNNGGWGNNELENYTGRSENVFVSNGNLIIEARNETFGSQNYTSTRMITKNKKVFRYGRIDIRAKMPKGRGIWPALWMLGNNIDAVNWPNCGEIDILELLGHEPNKIYGTMHWGTGGGSHASKGSSYVLNPGSFDQQFHVYSLIWKQDSIKVLIDDQEYVQVTKTDVGATYPFNADFFFIFNIAVGGNWPGAPDATTVFPQRMIVDYVRVFQ
jgi:beta-glucanase (GH16 family)